jgi:hypothetical protein
MRLAALALAFAGALNAAEYVQAVEFPYYLYPRALWERELVWLKNIGIDTIEFSVPWNFHQTSAAEPDFTGATNSRRDLVGFIRLLRRLGLRGWVRPVQPVAGLIHAGGRPDAGQQRAWLKSLEQVLAPQTTSHGGPIAYVEGRGLGIASPSPPLPVVTLAATDPAALTRSRAAIATAHGAMLWTDVEDALYPAGWAADPATLLRKGAVGLSGDEHTSTAALRRDAALLRGWGRMFAEMRAVTPSPRPVSGKLPDSVTTAQLGSAAASAVSVVNNGKTPFREDLRVYDPTTGKTLVIPAVSVAPGEALWLPLRVSIGPQGLCRDCTNFAASEHIVYATAELLSVEYENGILAMEFAAPTAAEVVVQFARRPVGPYLAAGKPTDFDWDEHNMRARLNIPAGKGAGSRVRIGIAIEAPETSAFFNELRRLVIGSKNNVSTIYSSAEVAARSRLRLPEGYTATSKTKSPNEIDYEISVPPEALHGDFTSVAIEADGVALGRARVQLFRPASIRLTQAIALHVGAETELMPDRAVAAIEPRAGSNLEIAVRNNSMQIQTYRLEFSGDGLEFFPAKTEISVAPTDERRVEFRVFAAEGSAGLKDFVVRMKGGAELESTMRLVLVPRGRTVTWGADLDGDGLPEWVVESQRARAVFSMLDGGRCIEFTWKDTNTNLLPEGGLFAQAGAVRVREVAGGLEFIGSGWTRTVVLSDAQLVVEQSTAIALPAGLAGKRGNITLTVGQPAPERAILGLGSGR